MRNISIRFFCLVAFSALLSLTACDKKETPVAATAVAVAPVPQSLTVKIGHAGPLTGAQGHLGKDNENGVRLAVDELNAENVTIGDKIAHFELLSEDDMADPRTATQVAQKLVDSGISVVIGHMNSGTSIPASKIYHDSGIVQISPSATAIAYTAQNFPGAMRVMANDSQQGAQLAHYAVEKLGMKKIAIIDDRTAYGQGLADVFEITAVSLGATVVKHEFTTDKSSDFNAILTNIKGTDAQLLFYGGMDAQAAPMLKQMHDLGLPLTLMGGDGLRTAEFLKLVGNDGNGVIGSLPGIPVANMQNGPAFQKKFEARFGVIQLYAPYAYDATRMVVAAMHEAGSAEPSRFLPVLQNMHYQGVTANIAFDNKGDLADSAVSLYKAVNGEWQFIETVGAR
ncbi:MAG TPA: branched-chain amino acid ABC transporter substrate-binding protein [Pseudomonadales bacterium]|nr:branched-chain amino acid ABC transporter substrate-binding protein [Pseudomonadales bacterium]